MEAYRIQRPLPHRWGSSQSLLGKVWVGALFISLGLIGLIASAVVGVWIVITYLVGKLSFRT